MAQRVVDHTIKPEDLEEHKAESTKTKEQNVKKSSGKSKKVRQKKKRGDKYSTSRNRLDRSQFYSFADAINLIRKSAYANFTESVELHINTSIDPNNSEQKIRFTTTLPHGTGKVVKILAIGKEKKVSKNKNVKYADVSAIKEIESGNLSAGKDFDVVIAEPSVMKDLAKIAKILGPRGMMPSPKNNTITENIAGAVKDLSQGQIEIHNQLGQAVIHVLIGNLDFSDEQLTANIEHIIKVLQQNSPSKLKKKLIQKAFVCTSMGPSLKLAL